MVTSMLGSIRHSIILLAAAAALGACSDDGTTSPPPPPTLRPLEDGTWHMHTADASALPVKISERFVGVTLEEIFLDSAQIRIDNLAGTYQQRYWTRVNLSGVEDRAEFSYDEGTFELGSGAFVFNSQVRVRTFTVTTPSDDEIRSTETLAFHLDAEPLVGSYRRTRP